MGLAVFPARENNPGAVRKILRDAGMDVAPELPERKSLIECRRNDESCSFTLDKLSNNKFWRERYGGAAVAAIFTGVFVLKKNAFQAEVFNLLHEKGFLLGGPWPVPPRARCPECGHILRTALAKQCFTCGADWH